MVKTVTLLLSALTVTGQVLFISGVFVLAANRAGLYTTKSVFVFIRKHIVSLQLLVSLTATLGSLFYSEIAHYVPCTLCWYQRILMYPQVLILGRDFMRGKKSALSYTLLLSAIGLPISLYHYSLQLFPRPSLVCSPGSADCAVRTLFTFGYISIPMMAATAFALIILLYVFSKTRRIL